MIKICITFLYIRIEVTLMMKDKYSAKLTGNPFLFFEMRVIAALKDQGLPNEQIKEHVFNENLLQYKTQKSIIKRLNEVLRRLEVLNTDLIHLLASADANTAKLICLYTIIKTDRLFYEFMEEVVSEKHQSRQNHLEQSDIKRFFDHKSEQSEDVEKWSLATKTRLLPSSYKNILKDAGLINDNKHMELQGQFISFELCNSLNNIGNGKYLKLMLGE